MATVALVTALGGCRETAFDSRPSIAPPTGASAETAAIVDVFEIEPDADGCPQFAVIVEGNTVGFDIGVRDADGGVHIGTPIDPYVTRGSVTVGVPNITKVVLIPRDLPTGAYEQNLDPHLVDTAVLPDATISCVDEAA